LATQKAQDWRQLTLALWNHGHVAVDEDGCAIGWRELPGGVSSFPQTEAAGDPCWHDAYDLYDSCVGQLHY